MFHFHSGLGEGADVAFFLGEQGKIPKNGFGNIDLYVPSMLPAGAIHLPRAPLFSFFFNAVLTSCTPFRQRSGEGCEGPRYRLRRGSCTFFYHLMYIPHAYQVLSQTGFEFRQRRANPILSGVVVAEENADLLVEVRLALFPHAVSH